MMIRPLSDLIAVAAGLVLALSLPAFAASSLDRSPEEGLFGFGLGYMTGNTLYHISVYDTAGNGIESELEFPLKTLLLGLEFGYVGRNDRGQDDLKIGIQWFTNINNGSGKLKDSDWLTNNFDIQAPQPPPSPPNSGYPHPGLDIYSESDIDLKANIFDLRASYNFWPSDKVALGPLGGFLYQDFQFDASNGYQVGYGPYAFGYTGHMPGLALTYEVTYAIPYLGIHTEMLISKSFQALLDLGYSPVASAEDEDDHVLRGKLLKATTSGSAYLAAITAQWEIEDNDFFLIRGQYLKIDTTGTQTQTWYRDEIISATETIPAGARITGIDDKITSQQVFLSLLFNHRF